MTWPRAPSLPTRSCVDNKFDKYSRANSKDAITLLYNLIDDELEQQLYESTDPEDSFATHWLNLMYIVRLVLADQYSKLKDRLKARRVSDYALENIEQMATDYLNDYKDLDEPNQQPRATNYKATPMISFPAHQPAAGTTSASFSFLR